METVEAKIVIQGTIRKEADGTICILANRPFKILEITEIASHNLSDVKTCELVEELKLREGVETILAGPYESQKVLVEGPAVVLVVTD